MVQPRTRALRAPLFLYSVEDVVEHLGGIEELAQLTARVPTAVHNWRALKRFPASLHHKMTDALRRRGAVAPPELWSQEPAAADVA